MTIKMEVKYEILPDLKIRALKDIPRHGVKKGDLGGTVPDYNCLSQEGDCWVDAGSDIGAYAEITGNALITGKSSVYDYGKVGDDAVVTGGAIVQKWAHVYGKARVSDYAMIEGTSHVFGNAIVTGWSVVYGESRISGYAMIAGRKNHWDLVVGGTEIL
jgi:carbonic anhydrase/acetyltransferase-like protein (isoleucine patch superfamily)